MIDREKMVLITQIVERADKLALLKSDRLNFMIDMEVATETFNLDLERMLNADNQNFAHDVVGIQNHINRNTKEFEGLFLPRFARNVI